METLKEFTKRKNLEWGEILKIEQLNLAGYKLKGDDVEYPYWELDTSSWSDDVKAEWEKGNVILNHKITPTSLVMPVPMFVQYLKRCKKYEFLKFLDEIERDIEKGMREISDKIEATGKLSPGFVFTVGVADGYATYVVTKVNKKSVHVELRKFCDGYSDGYLGCGRKLSMDDLMNCYAPHFGKPSLFGQRKRWID
jgi:hypothetical protein